jgi:Protein of unknown function (DUF2829).
MEKYIGVKIVNAKTMTRKEYNDFRGWTLPTDENGTDEGYLVEYDDRQKPNTKDYAGYVSWCPKDIFEQHNRLTKNMSFSFALEALKEGKKIARKGWNGKGMFVVYQKGYPKGIPCNRQTAEAWGMNEGDPFICNPYLQIRCVDGSHSMWVPSINDVLSDDWEIVV